MRNMRCTSFCYAAFLCWCVLHLECSALPLSLKEIYSEDTFNINEVDPALLEAGLAKANEPVKYVTAVIRNKRNFDYPDYSYYSSSSEEGNSFGYIPKPSQHYGFDQYWKPKPTPTHSGFGYWYSRPVHHHSKHCKHPYHNSREYEDNSAERFGQTDAKTTEKSIPQARPIKKITTSPPELPVTRPSTTTTSTTRTTSTPSSTTTAAGTTDYSSLIDIRSIH